MAEVPASYLNVNMYDNVRITSINGDYMTYGMKSLSTDPLFKLSFLTRRPYSDFEDLRQLLVSRHGDVEVPEIPPRVSPEDEFNDNIIQIRMTGFQQFLDRVLAIVDLKNDPIVQLFIQSHLTMDEIRQEVESNAQQEDINSNNQAEETTNQDNPDATDSSSSDSAASAQGANDYIFDMDDLD